MRTALCAFALGWAFCAPLPAWSGGDLCAPFRQSHYDELTLELSSTTIDGAAMPPSGALTPSIEIASLDDDTVFAALPDPKGPATSLELRLARQP